MICHDEVRSVIIETSCSTGQVALGCGAKVLAQRRLDEARRHARDLVPALAELLAEQGWKARDLNLVVVSRGPGSYTGLRVGIVTAKTLAYAIGCPLLAIDTFAAIARQAPDQAQRVDMLADAQQGKVYVQGFRREADNQTWQPHTELAIRPFAEWFAAIDSTVWVSGPGVRIHEAKLRDCPVIDVPRREPLAESLLQIALERLDRGECDDHWTLQPLYLRPSAAEEKWARRP